MKLTKLLSILIIGLSLSFTACDLCQDTVCENGGTCVDGNCECVDGFVGSSCQKYDQNRVQEFLDNGMTPLELYNGGISPYTLHAKTYKGGLIFYFDESNGTGLVAYPSDIEGVDWGCIGVNMSGLNDVTSDPPNAVVAETVQGARIGDGKSNTDKILSGCNQYGTAARFCRALGSDWFLPSRSEMSIMYTILQTNNNIDLSSSYWTSTEHSTDRAWIVQDIFSTINYYPSDKDSEWFVRPVRAF